MTTLIFCVKKQGEYCHFFKKNVTCLARGGGCVIIVNEDKKLWMTFTCSSSTFDGGVLL